MLPKIHKLNNSGSPIVSAFILLCLHQYDACNHKHSLLCADCQNIKMVLEGIREKIEDEKLDLTYDQRERAMWEYEQVVVEIEAWKTHLLRAFHQDLARLDALSSLDEDCLLYTSPSPRDLSTSRMPSSA